MRVLFQPYSGRGTSSNTSSTSLHEYPSLSLSQNLLSFYVRRWRQGDTDGDGRISLADFRGMLASNEPDPPPYTDFQGSGEGGGAEEGSGAFEPAGIPTAAP